MGALQLDQIAQRKPEDYIINAQPYHVLFLCTSNSARSIIAESLLTYWGRGHFTAYSAGGQPKGVVHPLALDLLQRMQLPVAGMRSKSWDEFAKPDSPQLDCVFTVCDNAAGEVCPVWPGQPMTAHWGVADPAAVTGTERDQIYAFRRALLELENRIKLFVSLPLWSLDQIKLQQKLQDIGKIKLIPAID